MSKVCLKCKKQFPSKLLVDGKKRNLQNRKYCLECSPFGEHNRILLHSGEEHAFTKDYNVGESFESHCNKHGLSQFVIEKNGHRRCKKCRTEAVVKARRNRKVKLVQLFGGCCEMCGYNKCPQVLQFHHKDPCKKRYGIAEKGHCRSWQEILDEAKKCVLLCSNCHCEVENGISKIE